MGTSSTAAEHESNFILRLASRPEVDPAEIQNVVQHIMDEIKVQKAK